MPRFNSSRYGERKLRHINLGEARLADFGKRVCYNTFMLGPSQQQLSLIASSEAKRKAFTG